MPILKTVHDFCAVRDPSSSSTSKLYNKHNAKKSLQKKVNRTDFQIPVSLHKTFDKYVETTNKSILRIEDDETSGEARVLHSTETSDVQNANNIASNPPNTDPGNTANVANSTVNASSSEFDSSLVSVHCVLLESVDSASVNSPSNKNSPKKTSTVPPRRIVFVHGWWQDWTCFESTAVELCKQDSNAIHNKTDPEKDGRVTQCLLIDMPCHGASSTPYDPQYCCVRYVCGVVRELLETHFEWVGANKDPLVFCGCSMGGSIAAEYTLRFPHSVSRLVLVAPAGLNETHMMSEYTIHRGRRMARWLGKKLKNNEIKGDDVNGCAKRVFAEGEKDVSSHKASTHNPENNATSPKNSINTAKKSIITSSLDAASEKLSQAPDFVRKNLIRFFFKLSMARATPWYGLENVRLNLDELTTKLEKSVDHIGVIWTRFDEYHTTSNRYFGGRPARQLLKMNLFFEVNRQIANKVLNVFSPVFDFLKNSEYDEAAGENCESVSRIAYYDESAKNGGRMASCTEMKFDYLNHEGVCVALPFLRLDRFSVLWEDDPWKKLSKATNKSIQNISTKDLSKVNHETIHSGEVHPLLVPNSMDDGTENNEGNKTGLVKSNKSTAMEEDTDSSEAKKVASLVSAVSNSLQSNAVGGCRENCYPENLSRYRVSWGLGCGSGKRSRL